MASSKSHRVSEFLPGDALKAIFNSLPRADLRRLALANAQCCDIIIPMLNTKTDQLLRRIPAALELYRQRLNTELPVVSRQLDAEETRLEREHSELREEIHGLENALESYGAKLKAMSAEWTSAFSDLKREVQQLLRIRSANPMSHHFFALAKQKQAEAYGLGYRWHQLKFEFHRVAAANSSASNSAINAHAQLAVLYLRAENLNRELSSVQSQISLNYEARYKYRMAYRKLRAELAVLRRDANSS